MTHANKKLSHDIEGSGAPALKPKKQLQQLEKMRLISSFEIDVALKTTLAHEDPRNFILTLPTSEAKRQTICAFMESEGVPFNTRTGHNKNSLKLVVSRDDFHKLQTAYAPSLSASETASFIKRFANTTHSSDFLNSNAAYATSFNRAMKLLHEHAIPFTCTVNTRNFSELDFYEGCTITLTEEAFQMLTAKKDDILAAEKARYAKLSSQKS